MSEAFPAQAESKQLAPEDLAPQYSEYVDHFREGVNYKEGEGGTVYCDRVLQPDDQRLAEELVKVASGMSLDARAMGGKQSERWWSLERESEAIIRAAHPKIQVGPGEGLGTLSHLLTQGEANSPVKITAALILHVLNSADRLISETPPEQFARYSQRKYVEEKMIRAGNLVHEQQQRSRPGDV